MSVIKLSKKKIKVNQKLQRKAEKVAAKMLTDLFVRDFEQMAKDEKIGKYPKGYTEKVFNKMFPKGVLK